MTPPQEAAQNSSKIEELESIRGLAALLIVFFHLPKWNSILDIGVINNGYLMVDVFFVLSGFVIFNAYATKLSTIGDLVRFQFLRFGRLYPIHLTFLAFFVTLEIAKYLAIAKLGIQNIHATPFAENNLIALLQQIFLLQAIGPTGNALTYNNPAWSISVEFYTYLIFGFSVLLGRKHKAYIFTILALASMASLATQSTYGFEDLARCIGGFSIGCLTASVINKITLRLPSYSPGLVLISIIVFLELKNPHQFDIAIDFFTSALVATIMISKIGTVRNMLKHKILTTLGLISYSVYMSHFFVLWVISSSLKRLIKRPEMQTPDGGWVVQLTTFEASAAILTSIFMVLLVSGITYSTIERPMRERSRRFAFSKLAT